MSIISAALSSVTSIIEENVPPGSPSPIPSSFITLIYLPILVFLLSVVGIFVSWLVALIAPTFIVSGMSIASDYRKITKGK